MFSGCWSVSQDLTGHVHLSQLNVLRLYHQEELQVPYEIKHYHRTPEMMAPKELLEVHPLGKSPVITDGPLTLAESGAIVGRFCSREELSYARPTFSYTEYVISKYGNGKGKPTAAGEVDNLYCRSHLVFFSIVIADRAVVD